MENLKKRYPGTVPFTTADKKIFFGRSKEQDELCQLIHLKRLSTLHGSSGLGKSSLIGAGVIPQLESEGYVCLRVRLGSYLDELSIHPLQKLTQALMDASLDKKTGIPIESDLPSLWQMCKYIQWEQIEKGIENPKILLIFDQFEELFTYPQGVKEFAELLAELLHDQMPKSFRRGLEEALEEEQSWLTREQFEFWSSPLNVKALCAIRSDRMNLLDRISNYIPYILHNCYELQPLKDYGAKKAIEAPAKMEGAYMTPPFGYEADALEDMLASLQDDKGNIEPFQLQILCSTLEKKVLEDVHLFDQKHGKITKEDLPDFEGLFQDYYDTSLSHLPSDEDKLKSRRLIEEGLVQVEEERRLTLDESQIRTGYDISPELLQQLVNIRLLRSEHSRLGGLSYELSHDSLIPSVLNSRSERKLAERIDEEKRLAREKLRKKLRTGGVAILACFLLITSILSILLYKRSQELQLVSQQILRAYHELGAFVDIDETNRQNLLFNDDLVERVRGLTEDLESAKHALRLRVNAFKEETDKLRKEIENGELSAEDLKNLVASYELKLDSLLDRDTILRVSSYEQEFQLLKEMPVSQKDMQVDIRMNEAKRLEAQRKYFKVIQKYEDILFLDPENEVAKRELDELRKNQLKDQGKENQIEVKGEDDIEDDSDIEENPIISQRSISPQSKTPKPQNPSKTSSQLPNPPKAQVEDEKKEKEAIIFEDDNKDVLKEEEKANENSDDKDGTSRGRKIPEDNPKEKEENREDLFVFNQDLEEDKEVKDSQKDNIKGPEQTNKPKQLKKKPSKQGAGKRPKPNAGPTRGSAPKTSNTKETRPKPQVNFNELWAGLDWWLLSPSERIKALRKLKSKYPQFSDRIDPLIAEELADIKTERAMLRRLKFIRDIKELNTKIKALNKLMIEYPAHQDTLSTLVYKSERKLKRIEEFGGDYDYSKSLKHLMDQNKATSDLREKYPSWQTRTAELLKYRQDVERWEITKTINKIQNFDSYKQRADSLYWYRARKRKYIKSFDNAINNTYQEQLSAEADNIEDLGERLDAVFAIIMEYPKRYRQSFAKEMDKVADSYIKEFDTSRSIKNQLQELDEFEFRTNYKPKPIQKKVLQVLRSYLGAYKSEEDFTFRMGILDSMKVDYPEQKYRIDYEKAYISIKRASELPDPRSRIAKLDTLSTLYPKIHKRYIELEKINAFSLIVERNADKEPSSQKREAAISLLKREYRIHEALIDSGVNYLILRKIQEIKKAESRKEIAMNLKSLEKRYDDRMSLEIKEEIETTLSGWVSRIESGNNYEKRLSQLKNIQIEYGNELPRNFASVLQTSLVGRILAINRSKDPKKNYEQLKKLKNEWPTATQDRSIRINSYLQRTLKKVLADDPNYIPLPELIRIEGDKFKMGASTKREANAINQKISLSNFYISRTEITFKQYDYFCEETKRAKPDDNGWGRGDRPVVNISWQDAVDYCDWLSEVMGYKFRLPTEAQWEYAAGGGARKRTLYAGFSDLSDLRSYANIKSTSGKDKFENTSPVKSFQPNSLGLYDMSGNVAEWCADWYTEAPFKPSAPTQRNPIGPKEGIHRVVRGGSWVDESQNTQVNHRNFFLPREKANNIGFRVARLR